MTTAVTDEQAEWLAWRRQGIGASDIPAILGLSSWASPWSIWADKVGLLPPDDTQSDYAEFGHWAELMVGPWFADRTGLAVGGEQMRVEDGWRRCTIDGFVFDADTTDRSIDNALGLLQVKTRPPGRRWDEVPADVAAQEEWEMSVTGLPKAWVAVLHGRRLEVYELDRDEQDAEFIIDRAADFWHSHVVAATPPPLDDHVATEAALAAIYPTHTPKSSADIDDVAGAVELLRQAKAAKKAAEADERAAGNVIRWRMKDTYEGLVGGQRAVTLGSSTRKTTCSHCGVTDESGPYRTLRLAKERS